MVFLRNTTLWTEKKQSSSRQHTHVNQISPPTLACFKNDFRLALYLRSYAQDVSMSPDVVTFSSLISACQKAFQWQQACLLFYVTWRGLQILTVMDDVVNLCVFGRCCFLFNSYRKGGTSTTSLFAAKNHVSDNAIGICSIHKLCIAKTCFFIVLWFILW